MAEPEIEDIVNPKLAKYLRERKKRKQAEGGETKDEETESQELPSEDENFSSDEQLRSRKIPMKSCFPMDRTVQNTIKLLKYKRKIENMIKHVRKEVYARKRMKSKMVGIIKTDFLPVTTVPVLPINEDSEESIWGEVMEPGVSAVSESEDYATGDSGEDNTADQASSNEDETAKCGERSVVEVNMWPPCPPFPKLKKVKTKAKTFYPFTEVPKYESQFSLGKGYKSHNLGPQNTQKLLRRGVAILLLHYGWQGTTEAAFGVLIDLAEEFFVKLTRLLRTAVDHLLASGSAGFPDALERVLTEMGLGGIEGIVLDYQLKVLNYHKFVYRNCLQVKEEYKALTQATQKDIISELECKIEDDDADVPEIHFPALGDGYAVDELQPSLEPGFQMLHSLEQEEQLQNLEAEEDMGVSDSPSQESQLSSYSTSGASARSKKKRKK